MPKTPKSRQKLTRMQTNALVITAGIIILAIGGWLWWQNIYSTPQRVFWATINNNLATTGITKHVPPSGQDSGTTTDQYTRLSFGAQNMVRSVNILTQDNGTSKSTVKTETIGTPDSDFARYLSIQTDQKNAEGKPLDFTKIQGIWGKSADAALGQSASASYFRQAVLGLVPFAYLDSATRSEVLTYMQTNSVYKIDFSKTQKTNQNGKSVYIYTVNIMPKAYASFLVELNKKLGLGTLDGIDPSSYDSTPPIKTQFTIDKNARQLASVKYSSNSQEEDYSGYGLNTPFALPTQTIPITELQNRIQSIQ